MSFLVLKLKCRLFIILSKTFALIKAQRIMTMNIAIEKQIGKNIKQLREQAGMTQALLSAKMQLQGCDITRSAIAKIEVGQRHLYPDEIILIKEILGVSYDEIFCITE